MKLEVGAMQRLMADLSSPKTSQSFQIVAEVEKEQQIPFSGLQSFSSPLHIRHSGTFRDIKLIENMKKMWSLLHNSKNRSKHIKIKHKQSSWVITTNRSLAWCFANFSWGSNFYFIIEYWLLFNYWILNLYLIR